MNCQEVQAQLSDYLDLSLDPKRLVLLEEHLAGCSPCREENELLHESIRQVAALPLLEAPLGFTQRVMLHVRETENQPRFWQRLLPALNVRMPAQATALVIVGILGIYLLQKQEPRQFAPATESISSDAGRNDSVAPESENAAPSPPDGTVAQRFTSAPAEGRREQTTPRGDRRGRAENVVSPPRNPPPPAASLPVPPESSVRSTPIVSSTPVGPSSAAAGAGVTTFRNPVEPANPPAIMPFADLELVVRRHSTALANSPGVFRNAQANQEAELALSPRPIERLMAAIPDHTRPQTIWVNVPETQYEDFKKELYFLGIIESEVRVPLLRDQAAGGDGHVRVKLTAIPAGEAATEDSTSGR